MLGNSNSILAVLGGSTALLDNKPPTRADAYAWRNWQPNAAALAESQPLLAERLRSIVPMVSWVYGRDGSLTAMDDAGRWWTGCSLPRRAAEEMLKSLEPSGTVGCFLSPTHARQLRAAFDRLRRDQAIIAVIPEELTLRVALHCGDFSTEIRARRLVFACGRSWDQELAAIFRDHPGLPVPSQFIRTALLNDESLEPLIAAAQKVIAAETNRRAEMIGAIRERAKSRSSSSSFESSHPTGQICVIAPSLVRLWNVGGVALGETLRNDGETIFAQLDPDQPGSASPLALAAAAEESDAVVAADVSRSSLPNVVSLEVPWITWITAGHIPEPEPAAIADALLLADPSWMTAALRAGWRRDRIALAGWPTLAATESDGNPAEKVLAFLCDTAPLEPTEKVKDFSSHGLLWEAIFEELTSNPFAVGSNPNDYLSRRMRKLEIPDEGFDRALFIEKLILPAYQQGIVRLLIGAGIPVRIHGRGWREMPEFADFSAGTIDSLQDLRRAAASATALLHPSPLPHAHPVEALGRAVVRSTTNAAALVRAAKAALAQPVAGPITNNALSPARVLAMLATPSPRSPEENSGAGRSAAD